MSTRSRSVRPRSASAATTTGLTFMATSQSCHSSTVKFGVTPGMWVKDTTLSSADPDSASSTTASYVLLSARSHITDSERRRIGSPSRHASTSAFAGSSRVIDANRRLGTRSPDARRAPVVRRNSSALSESSG